MAALPDIDALWREANEHIRGFIAQKVEPPSRSIGSHTPLPDAISYINGNLLSPHAIPSLPCREVIAALPAKKIRSQWVCSRHSATASAEFYRIFLDNYGNLLFMPHTGGPNIYIIRSLSAYHPNMVALALRLDSSVLTRCFMSPGRNLGSIACTVCGHGGKAGAASFPGCEADCLPLHHANNNNFESGKKFALAVAKHADEAFASWEPTMRPSIPY